MVEHRHGKAPAQNDSDDEEEAAGDDEEEKSDRRERRRSIFPPFEFLSGLVLVGVLTILAVG